jgi:hypothetical protein
MFNLPVRDGASTSIVRSRSPRLVSDLRVKRFPPSRMYPRFCEASGEVRVGDHDSFGGAGTPRTDCRRSLRRRSSTACS